MSRVCAEPVLRVGSRHYLYIFLILKVKGFFNYFGKKRVYKITMKSDDLNHIPTSIYFKQLNCFIETSFTKNIFANAQNSSFTELNPLSPKLYPYSHEQQGASEISSRQTIYCAIQS